MNTIHAVITNKMFESTQEEENTVSGALSLDNLCPQIELSDVIFNVRRFRVKSVMVQPYLYIPPGLLNP